MIPIIAIIVLTLAALVLIGVMVVAILSIVRRENKLNN